MQRKLKGFERVARCGLRARDVRVGRSPAVLRAASTPGAIIMTIAHQGTGRNPNQDECSRRSRTRTNHPMVSVIMRDYHASSWRVHLTIIAASWLERDSRCSLLMVCSTPRPPRRSNRRAKAGPQLWKQPMTPWGEPDLRGTWPLNHLISTPFQRPEQFGDRRFLTDEEFAAAQKSAEDRNARFLSGDPSGRRGPGHRLTSLLIDPPNGRFPALTPKGKELYDQMRGSYKPGQTVFDSPEDFDTWDRCITRGLPVSMLPRNYNNGIRIMQFPGYVVILLEMAHEARIIPTTKRPSLDGAIRQYLGESRGRWKGIRWSSRRRTSTGRPAMTNLGVPGSPAADAGDRRTCASPSASREPPATPSTIR